MCTLIIISALLVIMYYRDSLLSMTSIDEGSVDETARIETPDPTPGNKQNMQFAFKSSVRRSSTRMTMMPIDDALKRAQSPKLSSLTRDASTLRLSGDTGVAGGSTDHPSVALQLLTLHEEMASCRNKAEVYLHKY